MQIDIRTKDFELSPTLRQYVVRRLGFALSAKRAQIQLVQVMLSNETSAKGGLDKSCKIIVRLNGLPDIVVEDRQTELRTAIDRGASRVSHTLARKLMKQNRMRVGLHLHHKNQVA